MPKSSESLHSQSGAITILVALMLLVLLTVAAVSMSRNSFREAVISGTTRQGAMARNIGDSGVEWGILYIDALNHPGPTASSQNLQTLANTLLAGNIYGIPYDVKTKATVTLPNTATVPADLQVPAASGNGMNIALTCMGKMAMTMTTQTAGSPGMGYTPAAGSTALTAPDLWAIRSDAVVVSGSVTFLHSKEAWISTRPR
jgi:Tfp pilus assembly protein PilX